MIVRYPFLGVYLDLVSAENVVNSVDGFIDQRRAATIYFLNAHCYNLSVAAPDYRASLQAADLLLPDGVGVLWAARKLGLPHRQNQNGSDMIPLLCTELSGRRGGLKVFLLGGRREIAELAGQKLARLCRGVQVVGTHHGYFSPAQEAQVVAEINRADPDVVLVGMGVPKQELWIQRNAPDLKTGVIFGVGGLFDFLADRVPRAPVQVQQMGLEWAWRLKEEPFRLWRRYLVGNPLFISRVLAGRWSGVGLENPSTTGSLPDFESGQLLVRRLKSEKKTARIAETS